MAIIELPKSCTIEQLSGLLDREGALAETWESLVIDVPKGLRIDVSALVFLAAWGLRNKNRGATLLVRGDALACERLARMGLSKLLSLGHQGSARPSGEILVPLHVVRGEGDADRARLAVMSLVEEHFPDPDSFAPALEWAVNEILDNVLRHSESTDASTVYCEYFPSLHRLDLAICDLGRGIWASLGECMALSSPAEAIRMALQRGVTRNDKLGQGNGLAGVLEIARSNRGALRLWTDNAVLRVTHGEESSYCVGPKLAGTGVALSLDTLRPVDLRKTWIANLSYAGMMTEKPMLVAETRHPYLPEASTMSTRVLVAECGSAGLRSPATRMRERVSELLDTHSGVVELDFTGVGRASSSFLDELLGRMVDGMGVQGFVERIRLVAMPPLAQDTAQVVIQQRVSGWTPDHMATVCSQHQGGGFEAS